LKRNDIDQAISDLTRSIELAPIEASGYYNRGLAFRQKGDIEKARADFRRALELVKVPELRELIEKQLQELDG